MVELMKKINIKTVAMIIIIFIVLFAIFQNPINDTADDKIYKNAYYDISSFFEWANGFLSLWGGRIIALGLCTIFLNINTNIYIIIHAIVAVLLIYYIYKIINDTEEKETKTLPILLLAIMSMFLCIYNPIFNEAVMWVTGAFNYLWPCVALVIALIPFIQVYCNKDVKKWQYILYILASIFACNIEQTGAILVTFATILLILSKFGKIKIPKFMILNYILCILVFFLSLNAIGNRVRYEAELLGWFPNFEMNSFIDKIIIGSSVLLENLINSNIIIIIISALLLINAIQNKNKQRIFLSIIPLIYFILRIISKIFSFTNISNLLYTFKPYNIETVYNPLNFIVIGIGIFILLLIALLIFNSFKDTKKSIIYTLIYLAGICATLALSFSPTIFASGYRIFFVNDIMNLIVATSLISEINNNMKNKKISYFILTCIILLGTLKAIELIFNIKFILSVTYLK